MQADPSQLSLAAMAAAYVLIVIAGIVVGLVILHRLAHRPVDWRVRAAALIARAWPAPHAGLLVAMLVALQLVLQLLFQPLMRLCAVPSAHHKTAWLIAHGVLFHGAILVGVFALARRRGWSLPSALRSFPALFLRGIGLGTTFYLAVMPLVMFITVAYYAMLQHWEYPTPMQDIATFLAGVANPWIMAYAIVLAVLVAPAAEELLFRGIFLPLLTRRLGAGWAILITSAGFALFHAHVPSLAALTLLAMSFSLAYLYSGSIIVPIVMHGLFNGVNLALLWLARPGVISGSY